MKPFNLQAALAGAKVVTVSGDPVTGLHRFDGSDDDHALYGVVDKSIENWSDRGRYNYSGRKDKLDLRMAEDDQS